MINLIIVLFINEFNYISFNNIFVNEFIDKFKLL